MISASERMKQWRLANPERHRKNSYRAKLKKAFKLSMEEYEAMVVAQDGKCKICRRRSEQRLDVDHDHVTDRIRGLLCRQCNTALGLFGDNPEVLRRAALHVE